MRSTLATNERDASRSASTPRDAGRGWPTWAQALMSSALLFHVGAILTAALAAPPSSAAFRGLAEVFRRYYEVINQGYGYRYYARLDRTVDPQHPRPWGTPIVIAELEFEREGGETTRRLVRLPAKDRLWPGLRQQRQLDLAYHLASDPRWAASYARHLCKSRGCARVTIYSQEHFIPDLASARAAVLDRDAARIDLDAESTYGPRVKHGEFRCTDF